MGEYVQSSPSGWTTPNASVVEAEPEFDWSWTQDDTDGWVPPIVDVTRPSAARMYDYYLCGKDNLQVDRDAAEQVLKAIPDGRQLAHANRRFLR